MFLFRKRIVFPSSCKGGLPSGNGLVREAQTGAMGQRGLFIVACVKSGCFCRQKRNSAGLTIYPKPNPLPILRREKEEGGPSGKGEKQNCLMPGIVRKLLRSLSASPSMDLETAQIPILRSLSTQDQRLETTDPLRPLFARRSFDFICCPYRPHRADRKGRLSRHPVDPGVDLPGGEYPRHCPPPSKAR